MEMHVHFDRQTPTKASSSMKIARKHHCKNRLTTSFALINLSAEMTQHMVEVVTTPSTNHANLQSLQNQHPQQKPLRSSATHWNNQLKKIGQYKNRSSKKCLLTETEALQVGESNSRSKQREGTPFGAHRGSQQPQALVTLYPEPPHLPPLWQPPSLRAHPHPTTNVKPRTRTCELQRKKRCNTLTRARRQQQVLGSEKDFGEGEEESELLGSSAGVIKGESFGAPNSHKCSARATTNLPAGRV